MRALFKTSIKILKNRICSIDKKYLHTLIFCIILLCAVFAFVVNGVLINERDFAIELLNQYLFLGIGYICITYFPITIYNTFICNKTFDILFLSPMSLWTCFVWIFLKKIVPYLMLATFTTVLLLPTMIQLQVPVLAYLFTFFVLLLFILLFFIVVELILYNLLGQHLLKGIMLLVGIEEIVLFFILLKIFNGETKWLSMISFDDLIYNSSILDVITILLILGILFIFIQ